MNRISVFLTLLLSLTPAFARAGNDALTSSDLARITARFGSLRFSLPAYHVTAEPTEGASERTFLSSWKHIQYGDTTYAFPMPEMNPRVSVLKMSQVACDLIVAGGAPIDELSWLEGRALTASPSASSALSNADEPSVLLYFEVPSQWQVPAKDVMILCERMISNSPTIGFEEMRAALGSGRIDLAMAVAPLPPLSLAPAPAAPANHGPVPHPAKSSAPPQPAPAPTVPSTPPAPAPAPTQQNCRRQLAESQQVGPWNYTSRTVGAGGPHAAFLAVRAECSDHFAAVCGGNEARVNVKLAINSGVMSGTCSASCVRYTAVCD